MGRKVIITADGSSSIYVESLDECYHSIHGAIQESEHIFIQSGLYSDNLKRMQTVSILEIGFGTGLNALLTYFFANKTGQKIYYLAIEPYPLSTEELKALNYSDKLSFPQTDEVFQSLHSVEWGRPEELSEHFVITKHKISALDMVLPENNFDLVYFDAFSPEVQPELWSGIVFENIFKSMKHHGVLVTYSTKGDVKRALKQVGFRIEKLPGPAGKREILRGIKC
ncbi:MAG: tRNA (5-methylaminomethyl-2-thiouridine)(34)-methyltransferase MnmD [Bacteroidales bacterium]|jgi:tRNA U34 5-methylaminomethyl-2-thiouridine-forming methyltransferase MnmC|nr:tRNA (5-methylaminomethyl-2-thiouridine)(34)-methyltransferase MnmD [Bacteroidales bacterium]